MRRRWTIPAAAMALVLAGSGTVCATERVEDPVGDAVGEAPDIVAVTFNEPEGEPRVSVSVEFAGDPPLETDPETYTDVVFINLDCDPVTAQTVAFGVEDDVDSIIGAHAVQLPGFVESGGMVFEVAGPSKVHEGVVDVEVDGPTVTWTLDRSVIGDPEVIAWAVLAGVEVEDAEEMAYDVSPNDGEPWGVYELTEASG